MPDVLMLCTAWCGDCQSAKRFLGEKRVAYRTVDIDETPGGKEALHRLTGGSGTVPSFLVDGRPLVWPSHDELWSAISGEPLRPGARVSNPDVAVIGPDPSGAAAVRALGATVVHVTETVGEVRLTGAMKRIFGASAKYWSRAILFVGAVPAGLAGFTAGAAGVFVATTAAEIPAMARAAVEYARSLTVSAIGV